MNGSKSSTFPQQEATMTNGRTLLKAVYTFKGSHNDELNFKKGDVITLTQKVDGGWWEGTLNGKTGWFPANYVQEIHEDEAPSSKLLPGDMTATLVNYRQQVIKDLMDKESEFVHDLDTLHQKYLTPLGKSELVTDNEFRQLVGNLEELIDVHKSMNLAIEETSRLDPRDQKLGKIFLQHGSNVKAAHRTYWQSHPRAVCILEKYREKLDKFMEAYGASQPGLMVLTTALSKPFRHLEKYPGVAQEIEQHFEDDHPDRGDTQRSIGFYKSVAAECAKLRRQKELELEVLTGTIRDWEGESIHNLGDIVHMGSVAVGKEHKDRYFVLFPEHLLLLSVSARMSAFIYQGKLPLSGIAVNRLEDTETIKNAFEITGAMIDRIFVVCQSKPDSQFWVELLQSQIKHARKSSSSMQSYPTPPPHKSSFGGSQQQSPASQSKRPHNVGGKGYMWKMSCLRPAPPTRSYIAPDGKRTVKKKANADTTYEEDMQILRVIEAYCTSNTKRHTQAGSIVDSINTYDAPSREISGLLGSNHDEMGSLFSQDWRNMHLSDDEDSHLLQSSACPVGCSGRGLRDSALFTTSGCLPCKPSLKPKCVCTEVQDDESSSGSKYNKYCPHSQSGMASDWCCGMVATTVKKTTKKC
ncbi:rho guanine nucleotide exchange factor 7-like isoform X2 [Tigriopus californicus]|uniref:rho guanine nucleotide exchange factor 7-like isoform X2 n=1 Tax=Tigriopus californicus TaxID=6832 RepID=UPI0027DA1484|nr:rho guanine nucleotide exchange factor 7-like isoform X2 [Tigriopus californicus]